jgi:hypothetical protein
LLRVLLLRLGQVSASADGLLELRVLILTAALERRRGIGSTVLSDAPMTTAPLDRPTHDCHIVETGQRVDPLKVQHRRGWQAVEAREQAPEQARTGPKTTVPTTAE